jgi:hypothetical protein
VAAPAMGSESEGTVEAAVERMRPGFMRWRAGIDPDDEDDEALAGRFLDELPATDAALLRPLGTETVAAMIWEAVTEPEGYLRDAALLFRPWDFEVSDVRCPVSMWVGDADDKARAALPWWVQRLPAAEVAVLPDTSHLAALVTQWPMILRRLTRDQRTATG